MSPVLPSARALFGHVEASPQEQFTPPGQADAQPSLTPGTLIQRLETVEFVVTRRGYDQIEVDRFLRGFLADLGRMERARAREQQTQSQNGRPAIIQGAELEAAEIRRQASAAAHQMLERGRAEATAMIAHARRGLENIERHPPTPPPLGNYGAAPGAPLGSAARRA